MKARILGHGLDVRVQAAREQDGEQSRVHDHLACQQVVGLGEVVIQKLLDGHVVDQRRSIHVLLSTLTSHWFDVIEGLNDALWGDIEYFAWPSWFGRSRWLGDDPIRRGEFY